MDYNYAYIDENNEIAAFEFLPTNWKNVSNFSALDDEDIKKYRWYKIEKNIPSHNPDQYKVTLTGHKYVSELDKVVAEYAFETILIISDISTPVTEEETINQLWKQIRDSRDHMIQAVSWRYERYHRQVRMGLQPDDDIDKLDEYVQALADITKQESPINIVWPQINV